MRRVLRAFAMAAYLAVAASEHDTMWAHLERRPVAVLPIGEPMLPLMPRRLAG